MQDGERDQVAMTGSNFVDVGICQVKMLSASGEIYIQAAPHSQAAIGVPGDVQRGAGRDHCGAPGAFREVMGKRCNRWFACNSRRRGFGWRGCSMNRCDEELIPQDLQAHALIQRKSLIAGDDGALLFQRLHYDHPIEGICMVKRQRV